jgi:FKBP-type peptidyl-prolyl cis-trans isomerase FkpA
MKSHIPIKKRMATLLSWFSIATVMIACPTTSAAQEPPIILTSGLGVEDVLIGTGATADLGDVVTVHLQGWLNHNEEKGRKYFSTTDDGQPISFKLGTERVMPAWNQGVEGMAVGGIRRLWVPASLGYGSKGVRDVVPPDTDLIIEIELLAIRR